MTETKFKISIKTAQIEKGYIYIPRQQARRYFPTTSCIIAVLFDDATSPVSLLYNAQRGMIFGATDWLRQHARGQAAEIEAIESRASYRIRRVGGCRVVTRRPKRH